MALDSSLFSWSLSAGTAFGVMAWRARWLTIGGAIVASLLGAATLMAGAFWTLPLMWFFGTSTLLGRSATNSRASRTATQVVCNGGPALVSCIGYLLGDPRFAPAFVASICTACADTWATETGSRFGSRHVHILSGQVSAPGPSGVISIAGLAGALAGAFSTAAFAAPMGLGFFALITTGAIGFFGCLLDSVLGDSLQREDSRTGPLTNDTTNLTTTCVAALAGYFLAN